MEHPENEEQYTGLTVNDGVAQPPKVNPYAVRRKRKPMPTAAELVDGILRGDVTMLSRGVTLSAFVSEKAAERLSRVISGNTLSSVRQTTVSAVRTTAVSAAAGTVDVSAVACARPVIAERITAAVASMPLMFFIEKAR